MNEGKKETYIYFEGIVKAKSDKWYLVDIEKPEEAKGLEIGMPISQIKGTPTNFEKDSKISGEVLIWVIKRGVKEALGEKKEEVSEIEQSEVKAGSPSVVNINFDTSGLAIMLTEVKDQISGITGQIIDIKAFMKELLETLLKPKKSTKAKPNLRQSHQKYTSN
ncbi:unnamed protein product [marine sediment metagenome]|uniref:Uncharacterized protein n=1 Tax=marine sediment metagenome TaxID=412755 RepID=X1A995_9ZZZZ